MTRLLFKNLLEFQTNCKTNIQNKLILYNDLKIGRIKSVSQVYQTINLLNN